MAMQHRLFIAINIPAELRDAIQRVQQRLRYLAGANAMRWTRAEQLHLTLEFLGNVDASRIGDLCAAIKSACTGIVRMKLALESAGCFPSNQKPSVAWLGVSGDVAPLAALQRKIREATQPFTERIETREFSPHLTIGRVKNGAFKTARVFGAALEVEAKKIARIGEWEVRSVELMRSETKPQGAEHSEAARAVLELR
ncbi:MAG TPA: RNA 2',3'-cyclic phosphodiesterase [Planctomycetota bacterium]|nr:RNA 2',3'-cyclic phosphodiesterase [Planctomycetota bacterium]